MLYLKYNELNTAIQAALNMVTKVLSMDISGDGVLVVSFCPGWVQTDLGGPHASTTTEQVLSILKYYSPCFQNGLVRINPWKKVSTM